MCRLLFICCAFVGLSESTRAQYEEEKVKLSSDLNEISGLEQINDTLLVAHNDSGNEAIIYFLNPEGKIIHSCLISNAKNNDWEDLTMDQSGYLFIADCGNNLNQRKDLQILKIKWSDALRNDSIEAEIISFHYEDQTNFPPLINNMEFDCESIYWKQDSLYLVTKSSSKPWKGRGYVYSLSTIPGENIAHKTDSILIGEKGWMKDAVTSADAVQNIVCLLTYNRIIFYTDEKSQLTESFSFTFRKYNQKEALAVISDKKFFVGTEKHRFLGGPFLYTYTAK